MKFLIVFACLLAIAFANEDAKVLHEDSEVNVEDFKYNLELDNHIKVSQEGQLKDHDNWVVHGEYEYIAPDGSPVKVTYTADDTGYHPVVHA
ncbi:uncharacterized protein Dwil_GK21650 [Drosophila willistoni]|uniref:GK21650 n=1 Tax=Drosophila willistoni TaxID=7260 RepID=B4MP94_DROWI|nr:larval cuticle protein 9 [Drosophila willistoni]EDW73933.1 uncharacterized protein Dwil_GK21650 [Drosophila willistoni]